MPIICDFRGVPCRIFGTAFNGVSKYFGVIGTGFRDRDVELVKEMAGERVSPQERRGRPSTIGFDRQGIWGAKRVGC